jgi:hypothetical protein
MKAKVLIVLILVAFAAACTKNSSAPLAKFTLKRVNDTIFSSGQTINFEFTITHKNGGYISDSLFVARKFFTCPYIKQDTFFISLPAYNGVGNEKSEITYSYQYGSGGLNNGCTNNNRILTDSLHFYFWIKDNQGNVSDTIKSPKIILKS